MPSPATDCYTMGRNRIPVKKKDRRKIYVYPSGRAYGRDHFDFLRFRMIRIPSSTISSSAANPRDVIIITSFLFWMNLRSAFHRPRRSALDETFPCFRTGMDSGRKKNIPTHGPGEVQPARALLRASIGDEEMGPYGHCRQGLSMTPSSRSATRLQAPPPMHRRFEP